MKILYLCSKIYWDTKMSRVRFQSMNSIGKHPNIDLVNSGPGWPGYKNVPQIVKEHAPDLVIWYKPLKMEGFNNITVPTCLRYNEMWDIEWTTKEIKESKTTFVVCHHQNDIKNYSHFPNILFHNPHCAEKMVFKNYGLKKEYDILFAGVLSDSIYPFRGRLKRVAERLPGIKFKLLRHPGYRIPSVDEQVVNYAKELNKAKVVITCTSKYKYALAKFSEIPMCHSLLCADIPDENHDWYEKWMWKINDKMSDQELANILLEMVNNNEKRISLIERGVSANMSNRTQEDYATRFYDICRDRQL